MIQILKRFGWTWVGLLVSDDDYGLHVARSFQSDLAQSGGGCLAYTEILPWGNDPAELRKIVDVMKKSTARVVIVFAHEIHIYQLMEEVWFEIYHFIYETRILKKIYTFSVIGCQTNPRWYPINSTFFSVHVCFKIDV